MDEYLSGIYLRQVAEQAGFGHTAYTRLVAALGVMGITTRATRDTTSDERRQASDEFWFMAQALVVAAANVSKLLWSHGGNSAVARADLRHAVEVDDTSPVLARNLRNDYEHFDERIAVWSKLPNRIFLDRNIGDVRGMIRGEAGSPKNEDFFRSYDPATGELQFWGTRLNVHALGAELARVRDTANRAAETRTGHPSRDPGATTGNP